jgi:hypothetical protein
MDVIHAAKMISECGSKLNKLVKDIAAQVNPKDGLIKTIKFVFYSVLNLNQNLIFLLMLIVRKSFLNFSYKCTIFD